MISLGEKIKQARLKKGLSQEQLAQSVGTTKSTISKYELEKREPSMEMLDKIAYALGLEIWELFGGSLDENNLLTFTISQEDAAALGVTGVTESTPQVAYLKPNSTNANELMRRIIGITSSNDYKNRLTTAFDSLNPSGQQVAVERVEELTEIPKYQKDPPPEDSGNG